MATETVSLKLPSGEVVDAIVPAGLDDAGVKALVRMKHPDLFGPPAPAAGPHVQMQEHDLAGPIPGGKFSAQQGLSDVARGIGQVSAPGIATSLLQKQAPEVAAKLPSVMTKNATPAAQLPGQIITTGLMGMEGGLGMPDVPPGAPVAAAAPKPSAPSPIQSALTKMALRRIPGFHFVQDAVEFAKSMGWTEEKAAAAKPELAANGWPAAPQVLTQAKGLLEGGKPGVDPSQGLGKVPVKTPAPEPAAPGFNKAEVSKKLDTTLNNATGGKPLQPGVKLRDQFKDLPAKDALASGSSAVKDYKYDPSANELHVTANNGVTYVSGDVTPAQAQAFEAADSKGQAWKAIRDNSPLVAKVINGKRISMKGPSGMRSAAPEPDDLMERLKQSVEQALKAKSGR